MGLVDVIGLNYKDEPEDAKRWLKALGDPYLTSAMDIDGRVGIDWGVYGVPETFVVDQQGIIQYKHIGPVTDKSLDEIILPLIRKLKGASS
jgi:cytochrome c biogenesis protein CcmG/thiol:disulfide interchange protein DsbE